MDGLQAGRDHQEEIAAEDYGRFSNERSKSVRFCSRGGVRPSKFRFALRVSLIYAKFKPEDPQRRIHSFSKQTTKSESIAHCIAGRVRCAS